MEKAHTNVLINHKDIKLSTNWCLIKPHEQMEKYHLDGKETSIYVGTSFMKYIDEEDSLDFEQKETVDTQAQHWPISGTVIGVPQKNIFYGLEIKRKVDSLGESITPDEMHSIQRQRSASSSCMSEVDIQIGDEVIFDYMMNMKCYDEGLYFHTDIGTLFLIRYDDLYGKKNESGIKPLNGNIFLEWDRPDKTGSFDTIQKEIYDLVDVQYGRVTHTGDDPRYYLRGGKLIDAPVEIKKEDRIMFMPYDITMLESQSHLSIFDGKEIYTIKRYDILAKIE